MRQLPKETNYFCTSPLNGSLLKADSTLQAKLGVEQDADFFKITVSLEKLLKRLKGGRKHNQPGYSNTAASTAPGSRRDGFSFAGHDPGAQAETYQPTGVALVGTRSRNQCTRKAACSVPHCLQS